MSNNKILLNECEALELISLGLAKDESMSEKQSVLMANLLGTILVQLREVFMNKPDATGIEISIATTRELCSIEELNGDLPFFLHYIQKN